MGPPPVSREMHPQVGGVTNLLEDMVIMTLKKVYQKYKIYII